MTRASPSTWSLSGGAESEDVSNAAGLPVNAAPEVAGDVDPGAVSSKLAARTSYGGTRDDIGRVQSMGYWPYIEQQLNPTSIDDSVCNAKLTAFATLTFTAGRLFNPMTRPSMTVVREQLIDATVIRAVYSKRQLYERMVEFWSNHFNIDINNETCVFLKTVDDRDVIRPNALGRFRDLLLASARSPAMAYYLDNTFSTSLKPNENYARELMELHTLGIDGDYSQQDVREIARCFTGWGAFPPDPQFGELCGTFRFDQTVHDTGPKTVLGMSIPARAAAQGMQDGLDVLEMLAVHPSTARNIARKLCRWFLGESVPTSVEDAVAQSFLTTGGDIKAMLRVILRPEHLADAAPKIKRPVHLVVAALRALRVDLVGGWGASIRAQLLSMGMVPFSWGPPDGYPDSDAYWGGLLYARWNFCGLLAAGSIPGAVPSVAVLFEGTTDLSTVVYQIGANVFGFEYPPGEINRLKQHLGASPIPATLQMETVGLALSGPTFQAY
jgi:hypothetical protein